ncbi:MAG: barstar family protein [Bacteroidota bacterium]
MFFYVKQPTPSHSERTVFMVNIDAVKDKTDLLKQLQSGFDLPDYFGHNWDALEDCLTDLNWVAEKEVWLIHNAQLALEDHELETYLSILKDVGKHWQQNEAHNFTVILPSSLEGKLPELL